MQKHRVSHPAWTAIPRSNGKAMDVGSNLKFCPRCNTPVLDGAQFCSVCGSPINATPPPEQQVIVKRRRSTSCCCWVPVVLVAVVVGIAIISVPISTINVPQSSSSPPSVSEKQTAIPKDERSPEEILQDERKEIVRNVLREAYPSAVENYMTWKYQTNAAEVEYSVKNAFNARVQRRICVYFEEGSAKPTGKYDDGFLYVRND
jgi:hypothetical protein